MCGIVGSLDLTGNRDFPAEWLRAMTMAIAHRGPDDEYFHREPGLALGTRRVAIVDLAGGRQPLANEDETVWVSFHAAWLQVLQGRVNSLGNDLSAGDGAALTDENTVAVQATGPSEVISAEITGRRGVGRRATDPAPPRSGPAPPRATDPAPPDPAPPRDLVQQCVGVAPGDGAEGPLSRDGRQGPCPRGRGSHPPKIA